MNGDRLQDNFFLTVRGSQPAANDVHVGTVTCITDEGNILEQSDGSAWQPFSPDGVSATWGSITGTLSAQTDLQAALDAKANLRSVSAKTNGVASPYSILTSDLGTFFTNEGATAEVYLNLPGAAAGLWFSFCVQDADGLRIVAASGDTIRIADNVSASSGYIKSATVGSVILLMAINATEWIAETVTGVWEVN